MTKFSVSRPPLAGRPILTKNTNSTKMDTTVTTLEATIRASSAAVAANIVSNAEADKSYKFAYKKYEKWIRENPVAGVEIGHPLSRDNIDRYFLSVVARLQTSPQNSARILYALEWYANNQFYVGKGFVVRSDSVTMAIARQKQKWNGRGKTSTSTGGDPHKGLKDLMPESHKTMIASYIYTSRPYDWGSAILCFTWGSAGGVRGASVRALNYVDLRVSSGGYVPEPEGPTALCNSLLVILRKGDRHKDRHTTDKQVGFWRHKNYVLCPIFALAAHLVCSLSNDAQFSFEKPDASSPAGWWDTKLIAWDALNGKYYLYCTSVLLVFLLGC
jgi:hypothetical protein